ncbi:diguanylate cyclase [Vibrio hannami]|uniref:diguanylate cyclase n=1 Tax=Vibrio hannami TaxID=2717094 RepID=UPI0024109985|nr:diguanylate cyclase [Vibrio hannami]MDG3085191.1 diguanylate cyclase [Vibrio hannami]
MLNRFRNIETIYESPLSKVCRAIEAASFKPVILKILNKDFPSPEELLRFRNEFEINNSLTEIPGILPYDGIYEYENTLYLSREDTQAIPLKEYLKDGKPPFLTKLNIALQLTKMVTSVHQKQIIHKDINPTNLLWDQETSQLYLIDFGLASKLIQEVQGFINTNELEGTLHYISPEQTGRVNRPVDSRSDLYSLGVTLYELFVGAPAFDDLSGIQLVHAHIAIPPEDPSKLSRDIPAVLARIILKLMSKSADDRYQCASGVLADLELCYKQYKKQGSVQDFLLAQYDSSDKFHIVNQLYGREKEVRTILDAFGRTSQGSKELTLVYGYSGTGKSALVHELYKPLTEKLGIFISGKFDQYQSDVPYSGWIAVIDEYVDLMLRNDEVALLKCRQHLTNVLGNLSGVVTELAPRLALIIGSQSKAPRLEGEKAKNRFNQAIRAFFRAICSNECPVVIFIDDWQWADSGSINLLHYLMLDSELNHLLMICAWRDNEVSNAHPFSLALNELSFSNLFINKIQVTNLTYEDVEQLVKDSLKSQVNHTQLAESIYEKTAGNAFFVYQFLLNLHKEGILTYDYDKRSWEYDIRSIEGLAVSDNVVDLMTHKLRRFSDACIEAMTFAACIGNRFELQILSTLLGSSTDKVALLLEPVIDEGLLRPLSQNWRLAQNDSAIDEIQYVFVHDKVQEAAYELLNKKSAAKIHLTIYSILSEYYDPDDTEKHVFELVKHLNLACETTSSKSLLHTLITLNISAGKRAKQATAFGAAKYYFEKAVSFMPGSYWDKYKELASELYLLSAEAAFLTKDYDLKTARLNILLDSQESSIWKGKAYLIRIQAYTAQNRLPEAVDCALEALSILGVKLPARPKEWYLLIQLWMTKLVVTKKSAKKQLLNQKRIEDEKVLLIVDLISNTIPATYWANPYLTVLLILHITRILVKHGYCSIAGLGYSWWGILECSVIGNLKAGLEFGALGLEIAKKNNLPVHQAQFNWGWVIKNFGYHIRESIPELRLAYRQALELGDFEYAAYSLNNECQAKFHVALPLDDVIDDMRIAAEDLGFYENISSIYWNSIWHQTALNFVQEVDNPHVLEGGVYRESVNLPIHIDKSDGTTLFNYYCAKLMLAVYFNCSSPALDYAQKGKAFIKAASGTYNVPLFIFYESLALLSKDHLDIASLFAVKRNLKQLEKWAMHSPNNHIHRIALVKAKLNSKQKKYALAADLFDRAIEGAKAEGFNQECGLAWEMAAEFYFERGRQNLGVYYLKQARHFYQLWQARNKLRHLLVKFKSYLPLISQSESYSQSELQSDIKVTESVSKFDLSTILKATQTISKEIVFDDLIKQLLTIAVENAGAEKGVLFFKKERGIVAVAGSEVIDKEIRHFTPLNQSDCQSYSNAIFNMVVRTESSIIIPDAKTEQRYSQERYVKQNNVRSLFCMPIHHQGIMIGALYLENNQVSGAFTPMRVELLKLLSGQAAISLINANNYSNLEAEVRARTAELERASVIDKLTQVYNRYKLDAQLDIELETAPQQHSTFSVILLDVDHFKSINDTFGHNIGDVVLEKLGATMKNQLKTGCTLGRWGGEEFLIICSGMPLIEAMKYSEQLRKTVRDIDFDFGKRVSASFGVAEYQGERQSRALIKRADAALYKAKNQGRDRVVSEP